MFSQVLHELSSVAIVIIALNLPLVSKRLVNLYFQARLSPRGSRDLRKSMVRLKDDWLLRL